MKEMRPPYRVERRYFDGDSAVRAARALSRYFSNPPATSRPTLPVHQDPRDASRSPRQNRGGRT